MRYNDKYDAKYKHSRTLTRDKSSRVGEMASYHEDMMNEAIDKVYRELPDNERVIIDGLLTCCRTLRTRTEGAASAI